MKSNFRILTCRHYKRFQLCSDKSQPTSNLLESRQIKPIPNVPARWHIIRTFQNVKLLLIYLLYNNIFKIFKYLTL